MRKKKIGPDRAEFPARGWHLLSIFIAVQKKELQMVVTIVKFALPTPMSMDEARQAFLASAPNYRNQPGLVRKHYLLSEDGKTAGGIYCWTSREDAEALFTDSWKALVRGKYGADPSLVYFANPVTVDNLTDEIQA